MVCKKCQKYSDFRDKSLLKNSPEARSTCYPIYSYYHGSWILLNSTLLSIWKSNFKIVVHQFCRAATDERSQHRQQEQYTLLYSSKDPTTMAMILIWISSSPLASISNLHTGSSSQCLPKIKHGVFCFPGAKTCLNLARFVPLAVFHDLFIISEI